jgi:putative membrane protein
MADDQPSSNRSSRGKEFLQRWIINTLGVLVAANIIRGISYDHALALFGASLLLGILNAVLRPVLLLLSLPLLIVTLGLFTLIINALLLYLVGSVVKSFHVASFWSAFWGALVISLVSTIVNILLGKNRVQVRASRNRRTPDDRRPPGQGPVIDV